MIRWKYRYCEYTSLVLFEDGYFGRPVPPENKDDDTIVKKGGGLSQKYKER